MMAATLHFKGDALVAARAALQLWNLLDTTQLLGNGDPVDMLLVGRSARAVEGVRLHRTATLPRQDIRWRDGIPVAAPARAILGCAGELDDLELEAVLIAGLSHSLVRRSQLDDVIARNPRARGVARLRDLLERPESLHDTRSKYERRLLRLLRAAELPPPRTNVYVANQLVDAYWPDLKLVIEFDGWGIHGRRDKFESDRLRGQRLAALGHQLMRVTARQIDRHPYALVARIAGMITRLTFAM